MRIDLRHLRYAVAVADSGGFRAAAKRINVAQPAISKSVSDLEADLGARMFDRRAGGAVPTDAGEVFLAQARDVLTLFDRTVGSALSRGAALRGQIVIGYSALATSRSMTDGLDLFQRTHPEARVEMYLMSTDAMRSALIEGRIDVAMLVDHPSTRPAGTTRFPLWTSRIGVVAPVGRDPPTLTDLRSARFVMGVRDNWRSWRLVLDAACAAVGVTPTVAEEAWDVQVIFQRVTEGRGLCFYPMTIGGSLPAALRCHAVDGFDGTLGIAMDWADETSLVRALRAAFAEAASLP